MCVIHLPGSKIWLSIFVTTTGLPFHRRLTDVSTRLVGPGRKERKTPPAKRVAPDSVKREAVDASNGLNVGFPYEGAQPKTSY